jgi:hypothetical protein
MTFGWDPEKKGLVAMIFPTINEGLTSQDRWSKAQHHFAMGNHYSRTVH